MAKRKYSDEEVDILLEAQKKQAVHIAANVEVEHANRRKMQAFEDEVQAGRKFEKARIVMVTTGGLRSVACDAEDRAILAREKARKERQTADDLCVKMREAREPKAPEQSEEKED